jgi:hypothetical protein
VETTPNSTGADAAQRVRLPLRNKEYFTTTQPNNRMNRKEKKMNEKKRK